MFFGSVIFYDHSKGYGFLARDDGQRDIFVHAKALAKSGITTLTKGQKVRFEIDDANEKMRAIDVAIIN